MLRSLHIENVAVIRRVDVDFQHGFSALTGETGAGKSIVIDSINLLLGNRVSKELIRTGESCAVVGAVFEDLPDSVCATLADMGFPREDGTLLLQRTVCSDGRSQAKLDGRTITLSMQRDIARMLISIHGQSDSQKLLQKGTHRELLDAYANPEAELDAYRTAYQNMKACAKQLESVSQTVSERLRLSEMLKYQMEDIDSMKLRKGEEEHLIRERDKLLNAERINQQIHLCCRALRDNEKGNAYDLVRRAQNAVKSLSGVLDNSADYAERLETVASEIDDIAETIAGLAEEDLGDPTARIDRLEERLEGIAKLKRKYGESVEEILRFREQAAAQLEALEVSDETRVQLEKRLVALQSETQVAAQKLSERRQRAAKDVTAQVIDALSFLDMPNVRFEIAITPTAFSENGADDVEFLIAANPGEPCMPMIKIASGGELSRIMLALRSVLDDKSGASTVIFDEIDAGVSGKTARKIGMKLMETARNNTQVLCVTHSAQIASLANVHYRIAKTERMGRAETDVTELDAEARVEEIARILGGIQVTLAQRDAAREMIEEYR